MKQQEALSLMMMGHNVFLTGQAGSGKTYLLNKYIKFLKNNNVNVAVTASTGIASTHIGGITIHSWSGIGIKKELNKNEIKKVQLNQNVMKRIRDAKVLIIDEISMFHSYRLDTVDQICKLARVNAESFGGLQVVLCGDFFQLPPINDKEYPADSFAYKSDVWGELKIKICYLNEQHRQWDEQFLKVLNDIRSQDLNESTYENLSSRLNLNKVNDISSTKLYTHNIDVDSINNEKLKNIKKPPQVYEMLSKGDKKLIESLKKGCLAPEILILKKGAKVIFIKNNLSKGYINGTMGKVIGFDTENKPIVQTLSGKEIVANTTTWELEDNEKVIAQISQIPLRLAWAITVHKSQGMSMDAAEIDLSKSFAFGMGYVALSRLRSLEGLSLLGINNMALRVNDEIFEIDKLFKIRSNALSLALSKISKAKQNTIQKKYMKNILPKRQ